VKSLTYNCLTYTYKISIMKRILLSGVLAIFAAFSLNAQTIYFSQDFEAEPADWTLEDEWAYGNAATLMSDYFPFAGNETSFIGFNDDGLGQAHVGGGRALSPSIDLSAVTGSAVLEFNLYFINGDYQGADETIKVFASSDDGANWTELANLSALAWDYSIIDVEDYVGGSLMLAFEYNDGDAWNYGVGIDDVVVADRPINAKRRSYALTVDGGTQFTECAKNVDYTIGGVFINYGYEAVTSLDIVANKGGVETTTTFDGLDVQRGGLFRYELEETVNTGDSPSAVIVSVANVNGEMEADDTPENNEATVAFNPQDTDPSQAVVVEEATGAWCPWCPRGTVYLDEMSKRFGKNFIGIAVHNADVITNATYDAALTSFPGFGGFPSVIFNRSEILDPGDIVAPSISAMNETAAIVVDLSAEEDGLSFTPKVRVTFSEDAAAANYNFSVVLTEDDLSSDLTSWNQANNYAGGAVGPMGGWELFGTSVPSTAWPYDHVGRGLVGGYNGIEGTTGDYLAGEGETVELPSFTMDASWVKENMHVVAIVTNAQGNIVNAISYSYEDALANEFTSVKEIEDASLASVYPNPVSDVANIIVDTKETSDVTLEIIDMMGKTVAKRNLGTISGKRTVNVDVNDLTNGVYLFKVNAGQFFSSKKVMVSK